MYNRGIALLPVVILAVIIIAIIGYFLTLDEVPWLSPFSDDAGDAPGSEGPSIQRNTPQCSDGIDNDNDGEIDYPNDSGCDSQQDNSESVTKFGIMYSLWHCPMSSYYPENIYDISEILAGSQSWGPIPVFHWWDKPARGYYCLSIDENVLFEHAIMLKEAGIDFVYLDATNWPWADERVNARRMIMEPYNKMLEVWSTVPNAPKIVPWAPLTSDSTMMNYLLEKLNEYPDMQFIYRDKPLVLVVDNSGFPPDEGRISDLSEMYTVRKAWGLLPEGTDPSTWSFSEPCQEGFKESQGTIECNQRVAYYNGEIEQVGISSAYQRDYISNMMTAVPKFQGRTFYRQFETLFGYPETPITTIGTWNEWTAQRFCLDSSGQIPTNFSECTTYFFPDGSGIFVDQYDIEYNKDIEPAENEIGDFYYQLMKQCIASYKQGELCTIPICGNNILEGNEQCDDGNRDPADQCSNECTWTYCGDLIVQQPNGIPPPGVGFVEECDGLGNYCGYLFPGWNCGFTFAECNPPNSANQCEYDISNCRCSPPPPSAGCGNGVCEPEETCENCRADCWRQCPIITSRCEPVGWWGRACRLFFR